LHDYEHNFLNQRQAQDQVAVPVSMLAKVVMLE
jgi:hypothetical protein